jgi:hypothetical protein
LTSRLLTIPLLAAPTAAGADDSGVESVVAYGVLGIAGAIFDLGFTVYDA